MGSFGAIILAAGLSRRMGDRNKLLLSIHGKPMIRHVVETYLSVVDERVWVVTGYESERIEAALRGLDVQIVHNENFEAGQPFSVRAGLCEARGAQHYLIGLGDQPDLTDGDLRALMAAHLAGDVQKISIPYQGSTRGNPIIVPAAMRKRLLLDQANPGCGKFTRTHPELAQHHPMTQSGFFNDIDTPAAFEAFKKSTTLKDLI
ncbi:nucleotidyltransferase family protein [Sulfitobacter donghicola]|uniref:Molybdopterin-binding protein n=1 Tax=Sulfitobacter donghicola DSW-25 = KCTC 12864 = JCM 14565 TaxID=1300350 RepID=A0A073IUK3_9RHOB|nr:nucleotidyltransferase family protein [Sulfitobacter donghicola]KEJ89042.1 molybdopterin-binding protein [Sulfitobacter donghicola DSW-25 = KCTC 12864 = JCM 14565]KIN67390.1 Molybdopterin binding protein [Sulfitobacter donghicola DSW-25 = KCTC 12864 = JCM 14565]